MRLFFVLMLPLSLAALGQAQEFSGGGFHELLGPRFQASPKAHRPDHRPPRESDFTSRVHYWNEVALDANALDHTPVASGENRVFGEQVGPGRTARALAIVHIAMYDAVNAISGRYRSYTGLPPAAAGTSMDAAVAQAAYETLVVLYPSQKASFDEKLTADLALLPEGTAKQQGILLGQQAAAAILELRATDGSQHTEPRIGTAEGDFTPSDEPGKWRPDPISQTPLAVGAYWAGVTPFVMTSADQFRIPPPPALNSREYTRAFREVQQLGGDGVTTPTRRTPDQTQAGIFWAYDGTPGLGTPPRLYNQIALQIARQRRTDGVELVRLLALINTAMADAGVACWDSKYVFQFWRPVAGIREADPGTGPTGAGDGNPATQGDPNWTPLGAPASNLTGPNFTPPFPACSSGHATFGGALFGILRRFYRTDRIAFTFVSDELNGVTHDNQGNVRPRLSRRFSSLSQAEEENGQSRIYLGIHWAFDKTYGIAQGELIAEYIFENAFTPVRPPRR